MNQGDSRPDEQLKAQVHDFWNRQSCDTNVATGAKFSRQYFDEIERFRYADQPFIHSFAQFSRYHGCRVVEVGFGAGTDFIQWLRAGAQACGVDLTEEAIANLTNRIQTYGLPRPESIAVADAENLPFATDSFDLGYSFGVLHHTPDTRRAVAELVRVVRPGGEVKIMLYNRRCFAVFKLWVRHALLRGRPWRSLAQIMWHHLESAGTKGYTRAELREMLGQLPLTDVHVRTEVTAADHLAFSALRPLNLLCRAVLRVAGDTKDWRREDYVKPDGAAPAFVPREKIAFSGNRFGWFHCITAHKKTGGGPPA
jgi:SAM-dependent methyltransferase